MVHSNRNRNGFDVNIVSACQSGLLFSVFVRSVGSDGSAVMAGDGLSVVDDVLSGVWQKREQSE